MGVAEEGEKNQSWLEVSGINNQVGIGTIFRDEEDGVGGTGPRKSNAHKIFSGSIKRQNIGLVTLRLGKPTQRG